jgi:hypothetical protein
MKNQVKSSYKIILLLFKKVNKKTNRKFIKFQRN